MEQLNPMLTLPVASTGSPVSTMNKTNSPANQESFSSVYERSIQESQSADNSIRETKNEQNSKVQTDKNENSEVVSTQDTKESSGETTETGKENQTGENLESVIPTGVVWQAMITALPQTETEGSLQPDLVVLETGELNVETMVSGEVLAVNGPLTTQKNEFIGSTVSTTAENPITEGVSSSAAPAVTVESKTTSAEDSQLIESKAEKTDLPVQQNNQATTTELDPDPVFTVPSSIGTEKATHEAVINQAGKESVIPQSIKESVMTQIQQTVGKVIKSGENEIRLQLNPEHLGTLNIRIIAGKEGTQVLFKTDNLQSSQLIANQVDTLKTMLSEAGIKVEQVLVSDFSFSQQGFTNQEQQNHQNLKSYTKNILMKTDQTVQWENPYELSQSIVGLNFLA